MTQLYFVIKSSLGQSFKGGFLLTIRGQNTKNYFLLKLNFSFYNRDDFTSSFLDISVNYIYVSCFLTTSFGITNRL